MNKRPTMCEYEDCEWTKHKDNLCRNHWTTFFAHERVKSNLSHLPDRCETCGCALDDLYGPDNYCPSKLLVRKQEIIERIDSMKSEIMIYTDREIEHAKVETVSEINTDLANKAAFADWVFSITPPCGKCGRRECEDWSRNWLTWIKQYVLGPTGMLNVLYVLLVREGGEIAVPIEEAREAREQFTHCVSYYDQTTGDLILTTRNFPNGTEDLVTTPATRKSDEEVWPDLVVEENETESNDA